MAKVVAAGIFLVNKYNKVLICHPTNHKPDFWSIPKGKVEDGETLLEGALRETFEETNIDLSSCQGIKQLDAVTYTHKKKVLNPFLVWEPINQEIDWTSFDIKCNSHVPENRGGFPEMDAFKFVSIDEAKKLLHETQVKALLQVEKILENDHN